MFWQIKKKTQNGKQLTVTEGQKADLAEYVFADERVVALFGKRASGLPCKWCDDKGKKYIFKTFITLLIKLF